MGIASHDREGDLADSADDREDDPSEMEPSIGAPETTNARQQTDSQAYTWSLRHADGRGHDPGESAIDLTEQSMQRLGIITDA